MSMQIILTSCVIITLTAQIATISCHNDLKPEETVSHLYIIRG